MRILDELAASDRRLHLLLGDEVVVHAVLLALSRRTGRVAHRETEFTGEVGHQLAQQRALAHAARAAHDDGPRPLHRERLQVRRRLHVLRT